MTLGIIAEDVSDVNVLKELTTKLLPRRVVGFKSRVGQGCGKVRRNCAPWAKNLVQAGCSCVAVLHDLDTFNETDLRHALEAAIVDCGAEAMVVVIPKREVEAWLLYDSQAIAAIFAGKERRAIHLPGNPQDLTDPKKHLGNLVWKLYKKRYINTVHNERIAKEMDLSRLTRCYSFAPYREFSKILAGLAPRR
jgi:hypothetical protein